MIVPINFVLSVLHIVRGILFYPITWMLRNYSVVGNIQISMENSYYITVNYYEQAELRFAERTIHFHDYFGRAESVQGIHI